MWKVCQKPSDGSKVLVHLGYEVPEGHVEITITENQNYIEDEIKELVSSLDCEYKPGVPLVNYFTAKVDLIADEVYTFAISSPAKLQEYNQAAIDAQNYMANKKVRQPFVTAWAQAKGWTDEQAAQDILRTAALFRYSMLVIRTQRLSAKEDIKRSSNNIDSMKMILAKYKRSMDLLKAQIASA